MNNRSLRLDTECDVTINTALATNAGCGHIVRELRDRLLGEHLGTDPAIVAEEIEQSGSMIAAIEKLRGEGKTLRSYEMPDLSSVEEWLADNEVLDPEGPAEMFEPLSNRGLFRRLHGGR